MPKVTFLHKDGSTQEVDAPENWSIMQIAVDENVTGIEGACGGCISCATCHVYVHPDWVDRVVAEDNEQTEEEEDILETAEDVRETSRLGCQINLTDALEGLTVALPGTKTEW